jgi:hypothetical protein
MLQHTSLFSHSDKYHCPDDGGSKLLWNIGLYLPDYTVQSQKRTISIAYLISLHIESLQWCNNNNNNNKSVALQLWRSLAGWAAAADSLFRLHQTVLGWHVVSTSNPTATFSAFQTGPLLLYSSNYSVYPQLPQKYPKECPGIKPGTSVFIVFNANH